MEYIPGNERKLIPGNVTKYVPVNETQFIHRKVTKYIPMNVTKCNENVLLSAAAKLI